MFFFNLSVAEFLALFSSVSAVVVTLYLLNRSRKKQTVATLRFWQQAERPATAKSRRRIQQPWSLALQLISLALLLLAIAQVRWGSPETSSRDHVLILDTSAWMGARAAKGTLLDEAKSSAKTYIRSLPSSDRVLLLRADGLASPATGMESSRDSLDAAIDASRPAASSLDLEQALGLAAQIRKRSGRAGEVVFVGAGRVNGDVQVPPTLRDLRVLRTGSGGGENLGLRKIGLRRASADPRAWEVMVVIRNDGTVARQAPLVVQFGGAIIATRRVPIAAGKEEEVTFDFQTKAAGWLEARLMVNDALPDDNRAVVELPHARTTPVSIYTNDPDSLRPVFSANPLLETRFRTVAQYDAKDDAPLVVLDGFRPAQMPQGHVLWISPPAGPGVKIRTAVAGTTVTRWKSDHTLAAGLRSSQLRLEQAEVFEPSPSDIAVASVEAGPVVVARPGAKKLVLAGFHPGRATARFDLATPLLFANLLRWLEPEVFRTREVFAGTVGSQIAQLESDNEQTPVEVLDDRQSRLPYTRRGRALRFFAGDPGMVRVKTENREQVFSLALPDVGEQLWEPPKTARRGYPGSLAESLATDLWPWLAILGGLGLLIEWIVWGRKRTTAFNAAHLPGQSGAGSFASRFLRKAS